MTASDVYMAEAKADCNSEMTMPCRHLSAMHLGGRKGPALACIEPTRGFHRAAKGLKPLSSD
jgi:hypothetical protein